MEVLQADIRRLLFLALSRCCHSQIKTLTLSRASIGRMRCSLRPNWLSRRWWCF